MDASTKKANLPASVAAWSKFLQRVLNMRLDQDRFAEFIPIHFDRYPLPSVIIADELLRPAERQRYSLDPRVHLYLDALLKQHRVDPAVVLRALFKYSSTHAKVQPPDADTPTGDGIAKGQGAEGEVQEARKLVRWQKSYDDEERIFWRLAQAIHHKSGIRTVRNVVQVAKMLAKWARLFAAAAAVFSSEAFGSIHGLQARDELADARTAFVLLILAFSENRLARMTLSRRLCKGKHATS